MTKEDIRLHGLSFENEGLLKGAERCGCYFCKRIFRPAEITGWVEDPGGRTALCPYCGVDSVLHEAADGSYVLDGELLGHLNEVWFG